MTNAIPSTRAVGKLTFRLGGFEFPIKLYLSTEVLGLSGSLHHDGCGGKIRQWKTCEDHPNTSDPATISCIDIAGELIPLTKEVKLSLLGGNCELDAVSAHKLTDLPQLLSERVAVFRNLEVTPEKYFEEPLDTLLARLRTRRQFLLVTLPDGKTKRYGILLPSGSLMVLFYDEEIREHKHTPGGASKVYRTAIDDQLNALTSDFPAELTAQPILARIAQFLVPRKKIVAYRPKVRSNA